MKQMIFLIATMVSQSFLAGAQSKLNTPAPRIDLQAILQGGSGASVDKLASRYILLEFWATWCTPCVRNIPHLNDLQQKFKKKNIQFISITDEPKEKIELFLQKRKMNGWVGIDRDGQTFKNYGVSDRPRTFIIDNKGIIVFDGEPMAVTEQLLNNILSGGRPAMAVKAEEREREKLGGFGGGEDPVVTANYNMRKMGYLHQEVIRPTVRPGLGQGWNVNGGSVGISIIGADITHAVSYILELPSYMRVMNRSSVPDTASWDLIFSRSKGYTLHKGRKELLDLVCRTFAVAVKDTEVTRDVYVPVFSATKKLVYTKDIREDDPQVRTYQQLDDVFNSIENKTGKIVFYDANADEMSLDVFELGTGYYKLTGKELMDWVGKQGIALKEEKRVVKMKVLYDVSY